MTTTDTPARPDYGYKVSHNEKPPLALELLLDLVAWAEKDDAMMARFQTWGDWDQNTWSTLSASGTVDIPTGWTDPAYYGYTDASEDDERARREILRGSCGTSYCMAGQAVHQTGYRLLYSTAVGAGGVLTGQADQCIKIEGTGIVDEKGFEVMRDVPGTTGTVSAIGAQALGLTYEEAGELFNGDNTLTRIKELVNAIVVSRDLPQPYPEENIWDGYMEPSDYADYGGSSNEDDDEDDDY